jgi:hypothetical protein
MTLEPGMRPEAQWIALGPPVVTSDLERLASNLSGRAYMSATISQMSSTAIRPGFLGNPVGILAVPGVNSQALLHFPWTLVPTFYVPILISLHFLALRRVRAGELASESGSRRRWASTARRAVRIAASLPFRAIEPNVS